MKNVFIVLNPLNKYIMDILIKELNFKKNIVITSHKLMKTMNKSEYEKIIIVDLPLHQDNLIKKTGKMINLILNFEIVGEVDKVFIPSDYNILNQLILKKIKYNEVNYYEEGGTLFYKLYEKSKNKLKENLKYFLKWIVRVEITKGILTSKEIKNAYVFFSKELRKYNNKINYIDLSEMIRKNNGIKNIKVSTKYLNPDYVILTQPLTEDSLCKNYLEVKAIENFIEKDKKYIIKFHPRDDKNKYRNITKLVNVLELPEELNEIPYQILHYKLNPKGIVSHFSSVLYTVMDSNKNFERIALVKKLGNESIVQSVELMKKEMKNLSLR